MPKEKFESKSDTLPKFDFTGVDFSKEEYNGRLEFDSLEEMDAYFRAYSEAETSFRTENK